MANFIEATSRQRRNYSDNQNNNDGNGSFFSPAKFEAKKELTPVEEAQRKAEAIVANVMDNLVALSDKDFVRRLQVNALQALKKDDGSMLNALQTLRGRKTFRDAIFASAEMGLQIDGIEGCLVLYKSKTMGDCINFQPMWQGLTEIAYRTGIVKSFDRGVYCKGDDFEWNMGKVVKHIIHFEKGRGKVIGYWVRANLVNGGVVDDFKTIAEIEKVKEVSKTKDFSNSPWNNWYDEMAFKTVFRAVCKRLPKTEALNKALAIWDSDFDFSDKGKSEPKANANANPFLNAISKDEEKKEEPKEIEAEVINAESEVNNGEN